MEKIPFVLDIEEGIKFFYVTGADKKYHKVPGKRLTVRLVPTQSQKDTLNLALVVVGHSEGGVHITIVDEKSGTSFYDSLFVNDETFNAPDFAPTFLSDQIVRIMNQEGSFADLLKKLEMTRKFTVMEYGPLPAGHGQPAN